MHIPLKNDLEIIWAKFFKKNGELPTTPDEMELIQINKENRQWFRDQKGQQIIFIK